MIQQNLCGYIVCITQNNCLTQSKRIRMVLLTSMYNIYKYVTKTRKFGQINVKKSVAK